MHWYKMWGLFKSFSYLGTGNLCIYSTERMDEQLDAVFLGVVGGMVSFCGAIFWHVFHVDEPFASLSVEL